MVCCHTSAVCCNANVFPFTAMPEEGEGEEGAETDDMESLLKTVQSSIEQLGKLQQASVAS